MRPSDVKELLKQRLIWEKDERRREGRWGCIGYKDRQELRLPDVYTMTKSGWCRHEINAVHFTEGATREETLAEIEKHWVAVWDQEDTIAAAEKQAERARQEAARVHWESQAPERERKAQEATARAVRLARIAHWIDEGPPCELNDLTLDDLVITTDEEREVLAFIGQVREDVGGTYLALMGPPGTGKSSMAALWLREHYAGGSEVRWLACREFARAVRADADAAVDDNEYVDAMVFDDLDGTLSEDARHALAELFDRRRQAGLATCFTTNLGGKQLQSMFSPREFSRIMGRMKAMQLTGPDYRLNPPVVQKAADDT